MREGWGWNVVSPVGGRGVSARVVGPRWERRPGRLRPGRWLHGLEQDGVRGRGALEGRGLAAAHRSSHPDTQAQGCGPSGFSRGLNV